MPWLFQDHESEVYALFKCTLSSCVIEPRRQIPMTSWTSSQRVRVKVTRLGEKLLPLVEEEILVRAAQQFGPV
jgi:hypothetical protein